MSGKRKGKVFIGTWVHRDVRDALDALTAPIKGFSRGAAIEAAIRMYIPLARASEPDPRNHWIPRAVARIFTGLIPTDDSDIGHAKQDEHLAAVFQRLEEVLKSSPDLLRPPELQKYVKASGEGPSRKPRANSP